MRKERQRRAAAPKARLCGLRSFPKVTSAISKTNYWNTSSIPIFVGWKKCMSLSYPNSIFLPGFCLSLLKFNSVSWLVENPIYRGLNTLPKPPKFPRVCRKTSKRPCRKQHETIFFPAKIKRKHRTKIPLLAVFPLSGSRRIPNQTANQKNKKKE